LCTRFKHIDHVVMWCDVQMYGPQAASLQSYY